MVFLISFQLDPKTKKKFCLLFFIKLDNPFLYFWYYLWLCFRSEFTFVRIFDRCMSIKRKKDFV